MNQRKCIVPTPDYRYFVLRVILPAVLVLTSFPNVVSAQDGAEKILKGIFGAIVDEAVGSSESNRIEDISNREEQLRLERIERHRQKEEKERLRRQQKYQQEQREQELARQAEQKKQQRQTEQQAARAAIESQKQNEAMNDYLSEETIRPCISGACLGMTVSEVLSLGVEFINGPEYKINGIIERLERLSAQTGAANWELIEAKDRLQKLREIELRESEGKAIAIKGISKEERKYVAQFIGYYFDSAAFRIYDSAMRVCDYFDLKAMYFSQQGYPIRLYFAPFGKERAPRLALIEAVYEYDDSQLGDLRKRISDRYAPFNIHYPSSNFVTGRFDQAPDVILVADDGNQHLFLIDRRISFYLSDPHVPVIRRKIHSLAREHDVGAFLSSRDGCVEPVRLE